MPAIVGRERELAAVRAFVDGVDDGASSLLLAGEAGAGKTTIWRTGVEHAESIAFAVLTSRPVEPEAKLAYTGLGDVLSGRLDPIGELPAPQAYALRAYFRKRSNHSSTSSKRCTRWIGFPDRVNS